EIVPAPVARLELRADLAYYHYVYFFFSSRRRHTRSKRDWSSDVCSSDLSRREHDRALAGNQPAAGRPEVGRAAAVVLRILARPREGPVGVDRRRQQRLGKRGPLQIAAEIHEQQPIVGVIGRKEAQRERRRRQHSD